jgi:CheY-like chemotaxis protein
VSKSIRVLVVEDEELVARNIQAFMEDEDMFVHIVGSAEDALNLVQSGEEFDVCIMDLRLPGMDGTCAIRALHEICPVLRFVIHTGSIHFAIPDDLQKMGIEEMQLLKKPLRDMGLLADAVRALVGESGG